MGIAGSLIVYAIAWWLAFFMMLPIGVTSQHEAGEVVPGSDPGAPVNPRLKIKALAATGLAAVVWAVLFVLVGQGILKI